MEHVAKGLISIIRDGKSGSIWLIANEKPPKEIPYSSIAVWANVAFNQHLIEYNYRLHFRAIHNKLITHQIKNLVIRVLV